MLLASVMWSIPMPLQAQTQIKIEEPKIEDNDIVKNNAIEVPKTLPEIPKPPRAKPAKRVNKVSHDASKETFSTSQEEVIQLIKKYADQYNVPSEVPLCIARLESGYNTNAKNRTSSASGVFQYVKGTFAGTDEGKAGLSVFDADANVRAAIKYMASRRSTTPWAVSHKCPKL